MEQVREELDRLISQQRLGYAAISRLLGRNPSYIQQFIKRGSPRHLGDADRRKLARFFGVKESVLGGRDDNEDGMVEIPILDLEASAGYSALAGVKMP